MVTTEVPQCVQDAASRIAGTALGPFIMGNKNVDLDALERLITAHVIKEMNIFGLIVMQGMLATPHLVVEIVKVKPKRARKKVKSAKKAGGDNAE